MSRYFATLLLLISVTPTTYVYAAQSSSTASSTTNVPPGAQEVIDAFRNIKVNAVDRLTTTTKPVERVSGQSILDDAQELWNKLNIFLTDHIGFNLVDVFSFVIKLLVLIFEKLVDILKTIISWL